MQVGGGLNYVVGPMGSGKSLFAVRRIVQAVTTGRYVVTNVDLRPGWEHQVALHVAPWKRPHQRRPIAERFASLYVYETELAAARKYRLPPQLGRKPQEGRGVFVWDEGHNDLNNRKWKEAGRDELLTWATQLRKLGFVGYLLTQHADNTDAALRRIANNVVRLQNQREQTRLLGMRVSPWPLFLAYWYPVHLGESRPGQTAQATRVERYFLTWHRHLYNTMDLFHGLDADDDNQLGLVHLPALSGLRAAPAAPALGPGSSDEPTTIDAL